MRKKECAMPNETYSMGRADRPYYSRACLQSIGRAVYKRVAYIHIMY